MFLIIVIIKKKRCKQVNIITTYLYALINKRRIYIRPLIGFEADETITWLLLKALYGLRQAGHL
jgi:hypothetical protein